MAQLTNDPREQALLLGARHSLVGILTPPAPGAPRSDLTFLLLNSGVIHRVGANRLHVHLARDLAAMGIQVLRFDLSGIGDSPSRRDPNASLLDTVMQDIREVVDYVSRTTGRVVLLGLCSGAAHALLYGARDPRVSGLVLLDLWMPRTRGYYARRLRRGLARPRHWWAMFRGGVFRSLQLFRAWARRATSPMAASGPNGNNESDPALEPDVQLTQEQGREMLADAFRPLLARRIPILAVFTAGLEQQLNHARQMHEALPEVDFDASLQLEWFPDSDHSFSHVAQANRLRRLVVDWATTHVVDASRTPEVA